MLSRSLILTGLSLSTALACGSRSVGSDASESGDTNTNPTTATGGEAGSGNESGNTTTTTTGPNPNSAGVDILFVIDNSGSMGVLQARAASAAQAMVRSLEDEGTDFRMGFTTSDNGNPWCPGTTPEAGALVLRSCADRLTDFVSQAGDVDVASIACTDFCTLEGGQAGFPVEPWLESIDGTSNLSGATLEQAAGCMLPQGINGCGFESQLESLNKSLIRSSTDGDPAFGFLRQGADLLVVIVSDEVDCSFNNDWASIFEQSGGKVFWNDPQDSFPTSALCWNAGTACSGSPTDYECTPGQYDANGNPTTEPDDAVMHAMSRFEDRLAAVRLAKQETGRTLSMLVVGGYGSDNQPHYADSQDAVFMRDFGIGPGCSGPAPTPTTCASDADCTGIGAQQCGAAGRCMTTQTAIPPVRMHALLASASPASSLSVCQENWDADFVEALQVLE